jgi:predicted permease
MLIAKLRSYVDSLLHRSRREDEISDELQFHVESRAADLERGGLPHAEAMRRARVEFGGVETHRAAIRASLGLRWIDELGVDLKYAWRMLWRSKGFTAVAVGSLALGIGANTIIFSMAKGVLLDRLAVPHPEQLRIFTIVNGDRSPVEEFWSNWYPSEDGQMATTAISYPVYQRLRQQNHERPVLNELFAFKLLNSFEDLTVNADGHAEAVNGQMVSGNFYEQLGVRPELGRGIEPADDRAPGTGNVVVISDSLWSRMFGRSSAVLGKTIQLNLIPMTIVGVNPPGFTGAASVQVAPDVFFPLTMQPVLAAMGGQDDPSLLANSRIWWVQVMGRTRPEVPPEKAQSAIATWLDQDIRATMTVKKNAQMPVFKLADGSRGINDAGHNFATQLYVLIALSGFVLLLACANLANLLLARSATRQREMAVRLALGASRGRLLRQVLTESLLLASLGGAAGLALGYLGRNVIPHLYAASWETTPLRGDFDWTIFAFTAGVSLLTGVLFGLAPAWQATRTEANTRLKESASATTLRRKGVAGRGLVVVQVALSMLLVVGAGLFAGTLHHLYKEQLGFDPQNILLFSLHLPEKRYSAPKDVQLHERMEERLSRVPGVNAVTLSWLPMVSQLSSNMHFLPTDQPPRTGREGSVDYNVVGRSFFETYRIPVLYGRGFRSTDTSTSQPVALINRALAEKFWPHSSPVGKTFNMGSKDKPRVIEIVGVTADAKYSQLEGKAPRTLYLLYNQAKQQLQMTYEVKTPLPPAEALRRIRAAVGEIDKDLPLREVRTQEQQIAATISQQKTFAVLTGAFGVLALVLACIGIYGLMAYNVARRTNEIGIRMALGARASQMLRMVLGETSWLAVMGIGVGLGAALLLTKYVKSLLYGVTAKDPWILCGAGVLLLGVALLAGFGPARRASRVEPMEALRHE